MYRENINANKVSGVTIGSSVHNEPTVTVNMLRKYELHSTHTTVNHCSNDTKTFKMRQFLYCVISLHTVALM